MTASTFLANALYNHIFRNVSYTSPTTVYARLFTPTATTAELAAGTLTHEVSGGAYGAVAVTFGAPTAGAGSASTVTFATATAGWGTIRYVAIMDAATGGNILDYAQLSSDVSINFGNTFQFNTGALSGSVS